MKEIEINRNMKREDFSMKNEMLIDLNYEKSERAEVIIQAIIEKEKDEE